MKSRPSGNSGEFERLAKQCAAEIADAAASVGVYWPRRAAPIILRAITEATAEQATEIDRLSERLENLSVQLSDELVDRQRQAARIKELEAALQGRTVSCICGGEGKQEDLRRALAALAGVVDDVIKETASEFLRTMTAPPWYRRLYAAREAVKTALEGK